MNNTYPVKLARKENEEVTTLRFSIPHLSKTARPGQFAMLWAPDNGEVPIAFSRIDPVEFTIESIGETSNALCCIKKNDYVGVKGPYGNGFMLRGRKILIIAGGVGVSPLMPLVEQARAKKCLVTFIIGAKTSNELLFLARLKRLGVKLVITTDDGSKGRKCFACDAIADVINTGFDQAYTCGPEQLMLKTCEMLSKENIPIQLSLERYMKCGKGYCGSCAIDPNGLLCCLDGPVFTYDQLKNSEFGKYKRDESGRKTSI